MTRKYLMFVVALIVTCAAGVGVAQVAAPERSLRFEPALVEVDAPGRMEAWDAQARTLHIVPNADVKVCLPHTTSAEGVHEHCDIAQNWGGRAHTGGR